MYDLVLKNGLVIDPSNKIMSKLNVGIKNGKISAVTKDSINGSEELDCSNLIVSPGFVDIHIHEDPYECEKDEFALCISECMLRMGVTTVIGGNCGIGPQNTIDYLKGVARKGYPVNIGLMSAHGSLRDNFGSFDKYKDVDSDTVNKMCQQLEKQQQYGSFGLSLGLRYIPGLNRHELVPLCKIVKKYDGIVAAHVRDDAQDVIPAIIELIELSKETGVKIQISHIGSMAAYGQMEEVYRMIDHYAASGMDIGVDCYPYDAFCTAIGSTTFDGGFLERYNIDYSAIQITQGAYKGQRLTESTFHEIRSSHPEYLAVAYVMKEDEVDLALSHPRTILASDGILNEGHGHPRAAGTFPRLINVYVKQKKVISLYDAISKMTYLPAQRFGLGKGTLSTGHNADIVVFDLDKIRDKATFDSPLESPDGIKYVIINGRMALLDGRIINNKLGRPVKSR